MLEATCSVDGCDLKVKNLKRKLCNTHYLRLLRHGDVHRVRIPQRELRCSVDGCQNNRDSRQLCSKHLTRLKQHGSVDAVAFHVEKHGMHGHPLYNTWQNMRQRCYNPAATRYENYGARGIQVCDRWRYSFSAFVADVGERPLGHTLDRIDNNGNYEPSNVRWAKPSTQLKNQNIRRDNTSGHKGVSWDKRRGRWRAYKTRAGQRIEIGSFRELSEAVAARNSAAE